MSGDGSLSQVVSARLADVAHEPVSFAPGEFILSEGTTGDEVVVIREGTADVYAGGFEHLLAQLGPGDVIGEVAALAGGTRTATVRARTPLSGYRLERAAFEDLLDLVPELCDHVVSRAAERLERRHLLAFFERLFGHLESDVIEEFERAVEWISVGPGAAVFERGETADAGYFLISGRLQEIGTDEDGGEVLLREITRDELVGESGLFRHDQRPTTVVATRESRLVRIALDRFLALVHHHPLVLVPVVADLAARTRRSRSSRCQRTIGILVTADIDSRLFASRLADGLGSLGSTSHLWAARVDALLGRERVAQSSVHDPGEVRLAELLHEHELEYTYLLCEADRNSGEWTRRVARQADVVVAVIDARVDEATIDMVDAFFDAAGDRSTRTVVVAHPADTKTPSGVRTLTSRWSPHHIYNIRTHSTADTERLARLLAGRAVSLVLGGGGARGFAHGGVYRAMVELGIPIDMVGGSSMGSPLGAGIALDLSPSDYVDTLCERFTGLLDYTIPVVSLVKGERITGSIDAIMKGIEFEDLWRPFFCISTNLTRAREVVHDSGDLARAVRASVAIPGVIPPVAYGEDLHVDGGVLNNLPADVMRKRNPTGTVIAVDVAPAVGPRAKGDPGLSVSGWQALRSKAGKQKTSYPGIAAVLMRSMITASVRNRARSLDRGDVDLNLDLDLRGISLLDFENVLPVVEAGYEAAMPRLEAWLEQKEQQGSA